MRNPRYAAIAVSRKLLLIAAVNAVVAGLGLHCFAQGIQPQPQIGGPTSLPPAGNNGNRTTGRGLDNGGLIIVPEDFSKLTLAPGFLLNLQVYDMPEISSQLRIDDKGDIAVPLAGKVHVAGLTLPLAQAVIEKKLIDAEVLKSPEINLDVAQYAADNVSVLGEVQTPGRVQLLAPHNLPDVLAMVGGETQTAGDIISIRRIVDGKEQTQNITYSRSGNSDDIRNIMVQPGDTVVVPRAGIVYVLGGVNRPGGYVMQEDGKLDVAQALSLAYGTSINAAVGSIRVVRKQPDGSLQTIPISYPKITSGKEKPIMLQAEDIVYVPISKIKSVLSAGLAASTSSAAIYTMH
jgi:polysaccharide export outer membrane protein